MILAVYSIALNEIRHVERWLETTKHFDHRLVVDTGSTDGTPEALEAAGVFVFRATVQPWRFDVARNTALALVAADVDVCLTLDMDELIAEDFADTVRAHWGDAHQGWVPFDTGSTWLAPRLHSRNGWVWKYPIHEVLTWVGDGQPTSVTVPTRMWHEPDTTKSRGQYLPMLRRAVVEFPTDHRMHTYLVRELFFHQRWTEVLAAAATANRLTGWNVEQAAVCRWASTAAHHLGDDRLADTWALLATGHSGDAESWHQAALAAYWLGRWHECLHAATKAYDAPPSTHYLHDRTIKSWRAADLASVAAWNLGDHAAARMWADRCDLTDCDDADRIRTNRELFGDKASA